MNDGEPRPVRLVVVAVGKAASAYLRYEPRPLPDGPEYVSFDHRVDDSGTFTKAFAVERMTDEQLGVLDIRPLQAFLAGAAFVLFVAHPLDARRARLERLVAAARAGGALAQIMLVGAVTRDARIDDSFGADVTLVLCRRDPKFGEALRLFLEPVCEIGIVGWCFEDYRSIGAQTGIARVGFGDSRDEPKEGRAALAARMAIDDVGPSRLARARAVTMLIRGPDDLRMREIEQIAGAVADAVGEDAGFVYQARIVPELDRITVALAALGTRPPAEFPTAPEPPVASTTPASSARELLQLLLELGPKTPGAAALDASPPRRMRFERARALARALGLGDLGRIWRGSFVRANDFERYTEVMAFVSRWADRDEEIRGARVRFGHDRAECLPTDVRLLLEYRCALERARTWHDGALAATGLGHLAVVQARRIAAAEARRVEEIDALIAHVLDPSGQVVPRERLRELGYPEGDLEELDAEWL